MSFFPVQIQGREIHHIPFLAPLPLVTIYSEIKIMHWQDSQTFSDFRSGPFPLPRLFLRMILPRPGKKGGARERDRNGTLKSNTWDGTLGIAEESPQQGEDLQRKARPEGERPKEKSTYIPYISYIFYIFAEKTELWKRQ